MSLVLQREVKRRRVSLRPYDKVRFASGTSWPVHHDSEAAAKSRVEYSTQLLSYGVTSLAKAVSGLCTIASFWDIFHGAQAGQVVHLASWTAWNSLLPSKFYHAGWQKLVSPAKQGTNCPGLCSWLAGSQRSFALWRGKSFWHLEVPPVTSASLRSWKSRAGKFLLLPVVEYFSVQTSSA